MVVRKEFNRRELRGLAIVAKGGMIRKSNEGTYMVRSSDLERWYKVAWNGKGWNCECKDYANRSQPCKHIYAVLFLSRLPFMLMANFQADEVSCPKCSSDRVIRKGLIHNKVFTAQRYMCKVCKHRFSDKGQSKGLKGNPLAVVVAADLYFKGLSLRMIEDHLKRIYSLNVSYPTIHRWIRRFIKLMKSLERELILSVGGTWHIDETVVKIAGETHYLWNVLDGETKILLASVLTHGRSSDEAEKAMKEALRIARTQPNEIVTDGLKSYQVAVKNVFNDEVSHVFKARFTDPKNNNVVERLNETLKTRIKGFRTLSNKSSASQLFDGLRLYYNFIRPHSALGGLSPVNSQTSIKKGSRED